MLLVRVLKFQPYTLVMHYTLYSADKHVWSLWYFSFNSRWNPLFQCCVTCSVDPQTALFSTMKQSKPTTWKIVTYSS